MKARPALAALVIAVMFGASTARAEPQNVKNPQTFAYTSPTEKNYVRALADGSTHSRLTMIPVLQ